jgi:hypothetical protein
MAQHALSKLEKGERERERKRDRERQEDRGKEEDEEEEKRKLTGVLWCTREKSFLLFFFSAGIEPSAAHMLDKRSATVLQLSSLKTAISEQFGHTKFRSQVKV